MYQRIDVEQRMTDNEACEQYPDSYILIRRDSMYGEMGTVLYIGDNMGELISLSMTLNEPICGIVEGLNHHRSLGGVVVGG
ncbi:MAG: hypothetical protein FWG42_11530 [Clostridiales bacterium]|nr:hypothetical protein [Clostridiales bacterium]